MIQKCVSFPHGYGCSSPAHIPQPVACCFPGCWRMLTCLWPCVLWAARVSLQHALSLTLSAWHDVPYWQAQAMEPVCPDDGGVPADRRYSYAHTGTHPIRRHGNVTGSYLLHWPPIQAICDCLHSTSAARILRLLGAPVRLRTRGSQHGRARSGGTGHAGT